MQNQSNFLKARIFQRNLLTPQQINHFGSCKFKVDHSISIL
ncbi:hypothetical protein [Leptospira noguchii]|uniref:Uncharacterized protein n=1 Tax=Leptospira noguchii TaxID=28182 RepID=M6V561_9LEPT|nr:hypothetical protein [Leptospira noguchii]EMO52005.1 hypothetical protein LEP1GSC172_3639 [Leptospira noguchii]